MNRRSLRGRATGPTESAVQETRAAAADALEHTRPVLDVLAGQLHDVVALTEEAAISVLGDVQQADEEANALSTLVRELMDRAVTDNDAVTRAAVESASAVEQLVRIVTDRDTAVLDLVDRVKNLDQYVRTIRGITRATTILALNAKIEAVRAGEAGAGFSIVADEVRGLSRQSAGAAEDIGSGIQHVTGLIRERLGSNTDHADDAAGGITAKLERIARTQHDITMLLEQTMSGTHNMIAKVDAATQALSARTTEIMGHAQSQDITRQALESVISGITGLAERLGGVAAQLRAGVEISEVANLEASLRELQQGYVMHRQRATHASQTGSTAVADDSPAIELF